MREGDLVGAIRLVELLGEGGMGQVFVGVDERLGRQVAVKVIKPERRLDPAMRTRFQREARILSQLEHPNICRLYELISEGETDCIVLELVRGEPLRSLSGRGLSRERLFATAIQLTSALVAAHALSVVHRDLKPDNVLVTADGVVKVLDFGLARTVPQGEVNLAPAPRARPQDPLPSGHDPDLTGLGAVVGTPRYMSPEQARGDQVTAASDVFSLGLILAELFTGRPPFADDLSDATVRWRAQWGDTQSLSGLESQLRQLVDEMTAYRPAERPTAAAVLDRLRSIRDRPARRLRRLAVALVIASLALATAGSLFGLVQARRGEARAREARDEAEAVNAFLRDMLGSAEPGDRGREVKVVDILDRAAATAEERYAGQPTRLAAMLHTLGYTYYSLGHYSTARELLRRAAGIWRQEVGELDTRQLDTLELLGNAESVAGNYARALALRRLVLQRRREALGPRHPMTLRSLASTADTLTTLGRFQEAEGKQREALVALVETIGPEDRDTMAARNSLAITLYRLGRLSEAEALHRENLALRERVLGPEHPHTINSLGNLVPVLADQGKHDEALELSRREVVLRTRVQGEHHPGTLIARGNMVLVLSMLGRHAEAEAEGRPALAELCARLGEEHPFTLMVASAVAAAVAGQGRLAEAEAMQRETLATMERVLGEDNPATLEAAETLAFILISLQRPVDAAALLRHVVDGRGRMLGPTHADTVRAERQLAELLATGDGVAETPQAGPTRPPGTPDRSAPGTPPS